MKRTLLIVLVVLIFLLVGAWAYLLLNGAPENIADIRENIFGSSSDVVTAPIPQATFEDGPATGDETRRISVDAPLVQIGERAIAGAMITEIASSTLIRYVEKGTGHIYELDLGTGAEIRLSNTTIPGAVRAVWAPTGNRLVIETDVGGAASDTLLGTLSSSTNGTVFDTESLGSNLRNIAFSRSGGQLFYTTTDATGATGFVRDLSTSGASSLFTLPFAEMTMLWDVWGGGVHYTFTKPAIGFIGYLYEVQGTALKKIDEGATLVATRPAQNVLFTNQDNGQRWFGFSLDRERATSAFLKVRTVREKCAGAASEIWCAAGGEISGFPIPWYQGLVSVEDTLYRIDHRSGEVVGTMELSTLAREAIDVTDLMVGERGQLVFKNKRDDTLWLANPTF